MTTSLFLYFLVPHTSRYACSPSLLLCLYSSLHFFLLSSFFQLPLFMHNVYIQSNIHSHTICLFFAGAIAIRGGLFSDASVPVLIGSVNCSGEEDGLFTCSHLTGRDEVVSQCDPNENGVVRCQGKCTLHYKL